MYLNLLWFLITICALVLVIGYWRKIPFMVMIGWAFLFLISVNFMSDGLQYKTGETTAQTVDGNETTIIMQDTYTDYNTHTFPWYLAVMSVLAFVTVFFTKELWED